MPSDPTDIPRPHRPCGISPRDSSGTSPEQVLCAVSGNVSAMLRVPSPLFLEQLGGGLGGFYSCCSGGVALNPPSLHRPRREDLY